MISARTSGADAWRNARTSRETIRPQSPDCSRRSSCSAKSRTTLAHDAASGSLNGSAKPRTESGTSVKRNVATSRRVSSAPSGSQLAAGFESGSRKVSTIRRARQYFLKATSDLGMHPWARPASRTRMASSVPRADFKSLTPCSSSPPLSFRILASALIHSASRSLGTPASCHVNRLVLVEVVQTTIARFVAVERELALLWWGLALRRLGAAPPFLISAFLFRLPRHVNVSVPRTRA